MKNGAEASENGDLDGLADERQDIIFEEKQNKSSQSYPPVFGICCGRLPHQSALDDWLSHPSNSDRMSAEGRYAKDYFLRTHEAKVSAENIQTLQSFVRGDGRNEDEWSEWIAACIKAKHTMQQGYFHVLDTDEADSPCANKLISSSLPRTGLNDPFAAVKAQIDDARVRLRA